MMKLKKVAHIQEAIFFMKKYAMQITLNMKERTIIFSNLKNLNNNLLKAEAAIVLARKDKKKNKNIGKFNTVIKEFEEKRELFMSKIRKLDDSNERLFHNIKKKELKMKRLRLLLDIERAELRAKESRLKFIVLRKLELSLMKKIKKIRKTKGAKNGADTLFALELNLKRIRNMKNES